MSNLKNNDAKIATISTSHFFTPFLCKDQCKFYYFKILDTSCKVYIKLQYIRVYVRFTLMVKLSVNLIESIFGPKMNEKNFS